MGCVSRQSARLLQRSAHRLRAHSAGGSVAQLWEHPVGYLVERGTVAQLWENSV